MPGRRYAIWASVRDGSGAAESVCCEALRANASSASDRVPGVKPEGVAMEKSPSEGGRRLDWSVMLTRVWDVLVAWIGLMDPTRPEETYLVVSGVCVLLQVR
jgi:hypothetical protein